MANKIRDIKKEEPIEKVVEQQPVKKAAARPGKKGVLAKALSGVFSGTFLANEKNFKHVPFILFIAIMATAYIAYGYYADDTIRDVNKITNNLKELKSEFIYTKSELMFASKQSEVAKAAESIGLKEPITPPLKIKVDSTQLHKNQQQKN
ncbi:MAG: FtsL-like putative cell division protein [Bacteroidota bacterium]|nr:FtsL-like putative cell division protein [Bacteroidota bacterium]